MEEAEGVEAGLRSIVPARPTPGLLLPLLGHLPRWGAHCSPGQLGGADPDNSSSPSAFVAIKCEKIHSLEQDKQREASRKHFRLVQIENFDMCCRTCREANSHTLC